MLNGSGSSLGATYHDFSWLGLRTEQIEGIYAPNQAAKAPVLCAYVMLALARARMRRSPGESLRFAELFCADAFYAMFAARFGADEAVGFDNDREGHLASAERIRSALGLDNVRLVHSAVESIGANERFAVVANVGGLYHVDDPEAVLRKSWDMATDYLIVQNVVSLASEDEEYFCRPAPGLSWGNRYSRQSFDALVRRTGWRVILSDFNELTANPRIEDRGSVYYLIEKG